MGIENGERLFCGEVPGVFAEEVRNLSGNSMQTRHFHESVELYFLLEGERYYFVAQDTYHIRQGMAILINSNTIHKTSSCGEGHYRRFLMQLDMKTLAPALKAMGYPAETLGSRFAGPAEFTTEGWENVCTLIGQLKTAFASGAAYRQTRVQLLTFLLLSAFLEARMNTAASLGPVGRDGSGIEAEMFARVHEIAVYLQNNCEEKMDLESLAARYYVSKSYLTRIFRRTTGFTVTEYRTYCRIQQAKTLLTATDADITEIAARVGFGNITYFERVFRQNANQTPMQYRKSHGGEKKTV
ncbi:MAG: AraC family transcriptional regulator [Lachnospiraceae bacterium]|jgi:AraC-like DNA-binding protein